MNPTATATTVKIDRLLCTVEPISTSREWLVTNGLGSYAAGTVSGIHTRRYHGYLVAALNPPAERTMLVSKVEETVLYRGQVFELGANCWIGGNISPQGFVHFESFQVEGNSAVWHYRLGDALLEKRVWMDHGAQVTRVRYKALSARQPLEIQAKIFCGYRNFHSTTQAGDWAMDVRQIGGSIRVQAFDGATPIYILAAGATLAPEHTWYRNLFLAIEAARDQNAIDDVLLVSTLKGDLPQGKTIDLTLAAGEVPSNTAEQSLKTTAEREADLLKKAGSPTDPTVARLVIAADQFVCARKTKSGENGSTIIAGYPWFGDWGRDTMISLPGITLTTGRPEVAAQILRTFAESVDQGMLPNRFPDVGETPEYNTVDATLWYFEAINQYFNHTGDTDLIRDLFPLLESIIEHHIAGTRFQIHECPKDGLLYAGEAGVQLTWMDAKVGDWVVTPRIGKPVEINALWYNAVRVMQDFAKLLGKKGDTYKTQAESIQQSFAKFWFDEGRYCYDVIEGRNPSGPDFRIRPNQLFAVSLSYSPLSPDQQKAVVDQCLDLLYTPLGLRTLAPFDHEYQPYYTGNMRSRDAAYHQGTIWPWLLGPMAFAYHRVYQDSAATLRLIAPLTEHLSDACVGSISEIAEATAPFRPEGCFAQAWSVGEYLRVWSALENQPAKSAKRSRE